MSYRSLQDYGAYYDSSSNDQNAKDAYHTGRSSGRSAAASSGIVGYQASSGQPQYNGSAYSWGGQSQQNYSTVSGGAQSYANSTWPGINSEHGQQPAYDFQRQKITSNEPNATTSAGRNFYTSTSQATTEQSTRGLSNLAYASGLESAGLHDGSHSIKTGEAGPIAFSAQRNTVTSRARASSPALPVPQTYANQRHASTYSSHAHHQSGSFQQDLAASAAAALAGAVSRRHSNQQSSGLAGYQPSTSKPSMGNAPSREGYNNQMSQRAVSPHGVPSSKVARGTSQSAQHIPTPSSQHTNVQTQRIANTSSPDPASTRPMIKPQSQNLVTDDGPPSSLGRLRTTNNTAQNNSSIANLVTNISPQESHLPTSQQPSTPYEAMPSFIDPSQVFNPYHQEYERRKRGIAEAEAEARRIASEKSTEQIAQKPETWGQIVVPRDSTAPHPGPSSEHVREQPQKAGKRKEKKSGSVPPVTTFTQTGNPSQITSEADADMASEMKAMIERMREWKNKDPSMFSKLWEEMKKGGAATTAPTGPTPTPSPQIAQAEVSRNRSPNAPTVVPGPKSATAWNLQNPGLPAHLNGYRVVVENNEEGLPDLGRFPAERRYRQSYIKGDAKVSDRRDEASSTAPTNSPFAQAGPLELQPGAQPLPARTYSGTTIWPEEKRNALAEAAVKALNAEPANLDKGITPQDIRDMLEQNPSYLELCKLLENRGLRFHRGQFARQLLTNVPDLATTRTKAEVEQPQKPVRAGVGQFSTRSAHAQDPLVPFTSATPQVYMNGLHSGPVNVEALSKAAGPNPQSLDQTPNRYIQPVFSITKPVGKPIAQVAKSRLGVPSPNIPPPIPGSKDALSRKRDFSELVDLTQLSDDEDYVMPSKQPRLGEPSPEPEMFKASTDIAGHGQLSARKHPQGRSAFAQSLQFNPHQRQVYEPRIQSPQRPKAILARPVNKLEALRKSYYDPKTVARDILIAAGRHPSERPLNAHYAGLLHRHIELDSDLSTFDWDAVDPGGPPMPRVQLVDIPAGPPKWKLGMHRRGPKQMSAGEPIREQSTTPASPTPAIISLARLSAQTKNLLQNSQRAADAAAPGPQPSRLRQSELVDVASRDGIARNETPYHRKAGPTQSPLPSPSRSRPSTSLREPKSVEGERDMENPNVRRRGRPPGAKNKHPSLAATKAAVNTSPHVLIPSRPLSPPSAHFDIYDCQWRKCNAKLHNLVTLRKHISKVHRPSTEEAIKWGHTCWWKKCRTLVRNEDKTVTPKERFQSHSEWMDHIDKDHLHPLGMEKGDGPSTSHIGKPLLKPFDVNQYLYRPPEISSEPITRTVSYLDPQSIAKDRIDYLSDTHGRTLTAPSTEATNNEYAPDALILAPVSNDAEERIPIKQYMRAHGNEKMDLKTSATETLRAMEVKKERVGPGMDRGGCTLVNDERRATLLQNEGITRVIVDDG